MDLIAGGKKPQTGNGTGTDTKGGNRFDNYVDNYDHEKNDRNVLQDFDAGLSTNKILTCVDYGIMLVDGSYMALFD